MAFSGELLSAISEASESYIPPSGNLISVDGSIKNSSVSLGGGKFHDGRKTSGTTDSDKSSLSLASTCSIVSDSGESISSSNSSSSSSSSSSSISTASKSSVGKANKPHQTNDLKWEAIRNARAKHALLGLNHFKLLKRLGCGDIGSVYLCELRGTDSYFAMKVMDKGSLATRKKLLRAEAEREILQSLDHPFLPTLYTHFETDKCSCLVMEFCSGGDLHTLRQRQPGKYFTEHIARFYAAEVLLALEYLHMMGIVYRDLKPENVLVREDGHIMLTDFDLSLRCTASPTLVKSSSTTTDPLRKGAAQYYCVKPACMEPSACIPPSCVAPPCIQPSCFAPKLLMLPLKSKVTRKPRSDTSHNNSSNNNNNSNNSNNNNNNNNQDNTFLPELIVEPTEARSMSFVGTHEYLAPEIIKGEGHGSAVDWWTFGVFLYELLYGKTPFRGAGNRATLFNVVGQPLRFPDTPPEVSFGARDLIRGLLVKDPRNRLASKRGAAEIRQHPFFEGINWALIRSTSPPEIPRHFDLELARSQSQSRHEGDSNSSMPYLDFEFF